MFPRFVWLFFLASSIATALEDHGFNYNGFKNANLSLDGLAVITGSGLLRLTNNTKQMTGHAFHPKPFQFKNLSSNGSTLSFSTTFVFAIVPKYSDVSGHGISFVIAPSRSLTGALPSQYLGLFNETSNGNPSNHVVAVELDTIYSSEFGDINDNHVGIDLNNLRSAISAPAKYYLDRTGDNYKNLSLISGQQKQVWIEYDGLEKKLNVTIAPIKLPKPQIPLLSFSHNLSSIILDSMYVGFSSSTGTILTSHYILGWSFQMNGQAQELDLSRLPKLPRVGPKKQSKALTIGLPIIIPVFVATIISITFFVIRRKRKYAELFEDWELSSGSHRFSYKDLYIATKGFRDKELLGIGGFGRVYKGVLPSSKIEVAVKRVSHESKQGIKEFIAEIVSIGQLRHRNLVQLLGYCRRKGVASGLVYLHEEWEQVVIHRDVKASNVLIDGEFNGRLGNHEHRCFFAFGAVLLEVACGRRPIELRASDAKTILVDWVVSCWSRGTILETADPNLGSDYITEEMELVLKLGLLCSHSVPAARPSMRQVVQFLNKDVPLLELSSFGFIAGSLTSGQEGFDEFVSSSYPSSDLINYLGSSSVAESLLSSGG
ncbi:hypothetical protein IFM89_014980 [Coptis chinensis]|uniref:non-specific serine/threonine protein kinase n=1 Tax=Coptis chinensis TaxID=261450 RepID=A0A835HHX3_9MAGN|nr:hypothetical protein IFM89_014980 [Coptis chinensis]